MTSSAWSAFSASARRELRFLRGSDWDIAQVTWLPWLLLILLTVTFHASVLRDVPIAVVDQDQSALSRQLIRELNAAPGVRVAAAPPSLDDAWKLVRKAQVYAVVFVPRDATRAVERGESATVLAYYNASYLTTGQAASREIASVVQAVNASTAFARATYVRGRTGIRAIPVRVQSSILFNPGRSYEHYLCGLLFPATLQLALCLAAVGALGRELRDGSVQQWLDGSGQRLLPAVLGKLVPYVLLFTLYGAAGTVWIEYIRGDGIAGSFSVLLSGYALMYAAYSAIALLLVGLTRNMGTALSLVGVYSGVALGFSGGTFPLIEGSLFSQIWSGLMPFTAYVKLQTQQIDSGAALMTSLRQLSVLLLFAVIAGVIGLRAYGRAARDPTSWGRR